MRTRGKEKAARLTATAIIPARGGSKGIPNKNLMDFAGRSLVARCAVTCSLAERIGAVYVSTDNADIAEEAYGAGAMVIHRPDKLSGDDVTSEDVIMHALESMSSCDMPLPDVVVMAQCTAPFLWPSDIDGCIERIETYGVDHSFCAAPFDKLVWTPECNDMPPPLPRPPRQHRDIRWIEAGSAYACNTEQFSMYASRFGGATGMIYPIDPRRCHEIDTPDDLMLCRALNQAGAPWD